YSAYETQLEAYKRQQSDIRSQVISLQARIADRQQYYSKSVKMQLDPTACPQAFVEINIDVPEASASIPSESKTGIYKLTSIMKAYYDDILFGTATKELADKYGMEVPYFSELIYPMYDYYTSSIRIQVRYTDEETAGKILDDVLEIMQRKTDTYREIFGDFDFNIYIKDTVTIPDFDLSTNQMQKATELTTLQNAVNNAINSQANLTIPNPVKPYSRKQLLKDGIKFAIVGGIGGCFLMLLFLMCAAIMRGKIFTPDEIDGAYGLRNLASFAYGNTGRLQEDIDHALAQIEYMAPSADGKRIALVGTVGDKKLAAMRKLLSDRQALVKDPETVFTFSAVPQILSDAAALRVLRKFDGYILVEEVGKSEYRSVQKEVLLLTETGKEILGTIYI
ncbi:MAG: hypothetical protein Q4F09_07660, partial [Erysipelotrichaceae bacterium]|nr:hypothetical protein [Erysipelotrichaceae bacterium]